MLKRTSVDQRSKFEWIFPRSLSLTLFISCAERTLDAVIGKLKASSDIWDQLDILGLLHEEREKLQISPKAFMTPLRHALTGMKVREVPFHSLYVDPA